MGKQLKNKIFTLIAAIVFLAIGVILLLGALNVGIFSFAQKILQLLVLVALCLYVILALFPRLERYEGKAKTFVLAEAILVLLVALGQGASHFFAVPLFSELSVCAAIGVVIWLRGFTEVTRIYLMQGKKTDEKKSLFSLIFWMLFASFGVWQVARPTVRNRDFLLCIAIASLVAAVIFTFFTIRNYKSKN